MTTVANHRRRALVLAIAAGGVLAVLGVVTLFARTPTRASVMAQLARPARPAPLGRGFSAIIRHAGLRGKLTLSVNRASLPDPARLTIAEPGGRPITSAQVTLTYSMPSMNMWRVYSSRLEPVADAPGSYAATEGVVGMTGPWRIDVAIALPGRKSERFALSDRMPS